MVRHYHVLTHQRYSGRAIEIRHLQLQIFFPWKLPFLTDRGAHLLCMLRILVTEQIEKEFGEEE